MRRWRLRIESLLGWASERGFGSWAAFKDNHGWLFVESPDRKPSMYGGDHGGLLGMPELTSRVGEWEMRPGSRRASE